MKPILISLALLVPTFEAAAQAVSEFLVQRCNARVSGNTWGTSLEIHLPGRDPIVHVVGEDGLTDDIAYDGAEAVRWARSMYPDLLAGAEAYYDNACGYEQGEDDD